MQETTVPCRTLALTQNAEGVTQVALIVDEFEIVNPLVSTCGRFVADPQVDYGVSDTLGYLIAKLNQQLRFEAGDPGEAIDPAEEMEEPHPEPSQCHYLETGVGACPQCGSHTISGGAVEILDQCAYQEINCDTCGAAWNDIYTHTGFEVIEDGSVRMVRVARLCAKLKQIDAKIEAGKSWLQHFGHDTPILISGESVSVETYLDRLKTERLECAKAIETIERATPFDEYFAESVIGASPQHFDAIRIEGVRCIDWDDETGKRITEFDNEHPEFWSVYVHRIEGGLICVADVSTKTKANEYASSLSRRYGFSFG